MTDQLVIKTWWLITLGMVAITAIGCALTAYCGLFDLIAAHWSSAGSCALASLFWAADRIFCAVTVGIS